MFRIVAYRELWDQIRSDYDFRVYVRNDLVKIWDGALLVSLKRVIYRCFSSIERNVE